MEAGIPVLGSPMRIASAVRPPCGRKSVIARISKTALVAAVGLWASLVAFGNITDYGTNFGFVEHVLSMETVFPDTTIKYRAITNPVVHHAAYILIIAAEAATAVLCWIGTLRMLRDIRKPAGTFDRSKGAAIAGLTVGVLTWQVGFMAIGGEWFGMWMSQQWNGVPSAFRFVVTILGVLIYVAIPDDR
jgi:predicted small integral membrane protein